MKKIRTIMFAAVAVLMATGLTGCFLFQDTYYYQSAEYAVGDCGQVQVWCTFDYEDCYLSADGERFYYGFWYSSETQAWNDATYYCENRDYNDWYDETDTSYYFVDRESYVGDCSEVGLYCTTSGDDCFYDADGQEFYFGSYDEEYAWEEVLDYCGARVQVECVEFYGPDLGTCYSGRFCEYSDGYAFYEANGWRWTCRVDGGDYCDSAAAEYYYECRL